MSKGPSNSSKSPVTSPGEKVLGTGMDMIISAAWLYYHDNLTQAEIAKQLKISRPAIVNLLADARERGIVTIAIRPDLLGQLDLAEQIRTRFGLTNAYVVPSAENAPTATVHQALGKAGAMLLEKMLRPGQIVATTWGSTILEVARALPETRIEDLILAQAVGCLNSGESLNPIRLASLMAEKLGAKAYHLPLPAVVSSPEIKKILIEDRSVRSCMDMARAASLALMGIGKVSYDATVVSAGFFDRAMIDELKAKGAVGDISCRFFDIHGHSIATDFDDRVISLTLDDMRRIKPVIAVAGGGDKVNAVLGALRTGCLDVLITDEQTARKVLAFDASGDPSSLRGTV